VGDFTTVEEQLAALGTGALVLSDEQRAGLDEDGYLVVPDALTPFELDGLRDAFDRLIAEEGDRAGIEVHQEAGTQRLSDLVNKDPAFERAWTHPVQLAAIGHVLSAPFKLSSLNGRSALPGEGLQGLHCDWHAPGVEGDYQVCNSVWMLDDFTESNGATRVVPGSHRCGGLPQDALEDTTAPHPDEVVVTGAAGTLVVMSSHVWHGGTQNRSASPRRALHGYFVRREHGQQLHQRDVIRPPVRARLTPAQQHLLDV
jgi:ectoine hydroxylase-related dioxygenase (phytanoyl-CoA dioxygenase family)